MSKSKTKFDTSLRILITNEPFVYGGTPKLLGSGTSGEVWRVKDKNNNDVAVKLAKLDPEKDMGVLDSSIIQEAAILTKLDHPNIVKLLDVVLSNKNMGLVLPLAARTLRDYIKNMPKDRETVLRNAKIVTLQFARAIQYLQSMDVLHGDYKPENTLIFEDTDTCSLRIVITDFGIASTRHCYQTDTNPAFTIWYRAPEIFLGGYSEYDTPGDIWALGCITAELLTGNALFDLNTESGVLFFIFNKLGKPTDRDWPGVTRLRDWNERQAELEEESKTRKIVLPTTTVTDQTKSTRYAYYSDTNNTQRVPLNKPEQDFINSLLILDPKRRPSISTVLQNQWLQPTVRLLEQTSCYRSPIIHEGSCHDRLNLRAPPTPTKLVREIPPIAYTWLYNYIITQFDKSDKEIAIAVYIVKRFFSKIDPKETINNTSVYMACIQITTMLVSSPYVGLSAFPYDINLLKQAQLHVLRVVGFNLMVSTSYDFLKDYSSHYPPLVWEVGKCLLLLSYYTDIYTGKNPDLIALICLMLACNAIGQPFKHRKELKIFSLDSITTILVKFGESLNQSLQQMNPEQRKEFIVNTARGSIDTVSVIKNVMPLSISIDPEYLSVKESTKPPPNVENLTTLLSKLRT